MNPKLLSISSFALLWFPPVFAQAAQPFHDPVDQPFRRAPMAEASRSIVIPLATNLHLAFDAKLLRSHSIWAGGGLNLFGPPYHAGKTPFICTPGGERLWQMPPRRPWQTAAPGTSVHSGLTAGADFNAISTAGGRVTLTYEVGLGNGASVRIQETPGAVNAHDTVAVRRAFEVAPCDVDLWFLAHAEMGRMWQQTVATRIEGVQRTNDVLVAALHAPDALQWEQAQSFVSYTEELNREQNGDSAVETITVSGDQVRLFVRIPARKEVVKFSVDTAVCRNDEHAKHVARDLAKAGGKAVARTSVEIEAERPPVFAGGKPARPGGDEYVQIEHFPIPPSVRLMVTGMDWMPNGDLVVCTWPGEIYIVEDAQGPVEAARYRRFATGLNEPLGVTVAGDSLYVVQKSELTRIRDTNDDGEADLFESLCDDWGYSGNYHAFAFGPVMGNHQDWFVFLCGQRGRWEMPYVGWAFRVDAAGNINGYCRGLRAPNGVGMYNGDLFMTDNQGNWIGACKLNHLQPGRFYGFPSGQPAPRSEYEKPTQFEPPAIWFPRKLSPSTSGFDTIPAGAFGPFEGQLLVGDFQNAVVMRVALEKVNGAWQGAVWPFARGFYSGVNRLTIGADGRAYVGGLKNRAWAATAPREFSLDRLSLKGEIPFEVQNARATADGFRLDFTAPVDRVAAMNTDNYFVAQYTYRYHSAYGSPEIDHEGNENSMTEITVDRVNVSENGKAVDLMLKGWRKGYVTMVRLGDVTSSDAQSLWHDTFYYTLNQIPN